jgi:hypothetical protein
MVEDGDVEETSCEDCGEQASRLMTSFGGFEFESGRVEDGTIGVDSVDNEIDKIVGRDAEKRWEEIKDRQHHKRSIARRRTGHEGAPLKRKPSTGEYDVMEEEEQTKKSYLYEQREEYKNQTNRSEDKSKEKSKEKSEDN